MGSIDWLVLLHPWPKQICADYWFIAGIILPVTITASTFVWFAVGGAQDLHKLFVRLATARRDATDDGTVPNPTPTSFGFPVVMAAKTDAEGASPVQTS